MKKIFCFLCLLVFFGQSQADDLIDSNRLFDCVELEYSDLFSPSGEETFALDEYWVRYYAETDTYLGTIGRDVYVYGDIFGGLLYVGQLDELLESICPVVARANLSGSWRIIGEVDARNCGEGIQRTDSVATVTENGNQVTMVLRGNTRVGVLEEDTIRYTVRYAEDGGTTNETGIITVISGTSISGAQDWTWSNGQLSCSGKSTFSGTKI